MENKKDLDLEITTALLEAKHTYETLIVGKSLDEMNLIAFHFSQTLDVDMSELRLREGMRQRKKRLGNLHR